MKRSYVVVAMVAALAAQTFAANIEVRALLGGAFSAGRDVTGLYGYDLTSYKGVGTATGDTSFSEYNDEYASFGNGLKIDLDATLYLNDNFGVMAMFGVSFLGGRKIEQEYTDVLGVKTTREINLNGNAIPILVGAKFKTSLSKLAPYLYLATGIYIPAGVDGEANITQTGMPDTDVEIETKMSAGLGFSGGLGAVYQATEMIGICAEFAPTYAFARLKELEVKSSAAGVTRTNTTIYERDEQDLPADNIGTTANTFYQHGGPMLSFSSFAIKVGVVIRL